MVRLVNKEDDVIASVVQWVGIQYPNAEFFHIPNEIDFTPKNKNHMYAVLTKRKKRGLKSGVSDLFFCDPRGRYHGFFLELKRSTSANKRDAQIAFGARVAALGYFFSFACSFDEAKSLIKKYYSL